MEIQLWRELLDPYTLAVEELVLKFNHIILEHKTLFFDKEKYKKDISKINNSTTKNVYYFYNKFLNDDKN